MEEIFREREAPSFIFWRALKRGCCFFLFRYCITEEFGNRVFVSIVSSFSTSKPYFNPKAQQGRKKKGEVKRSWSEWEVKASSLFLFY